MNLKENINKHILSDLTNNNSNNIKIDKVLLEEELRCPICKIFYDSNIHIPFVINCGHTFCKKCILNNSNNKCPIDSIINSFKFYIRNIQIENIVNKILIYNKEMPSQDKMIYIKPDIKINKNLNDNNEENKNINDKEKSKKLRGKSINQRSKLNNFGINSPNSPDSSQKNYYNKNKINKHFKSPNVKILKNGNQLNNLINYNSNSENTNRLNFIEDNFILEDEQFDDMQMTETIGTIPIFEEKSLTNSIQEDFNDLLNKNEIYKKRIINNRNQNYHFVSPIKRNKNLDINENFFKEQNKKIILFEEQDFLTQKPLKLSNYNLNHEKISKENRQLTEINQLNNNNINSTNNSNKTEKKKENKKYQKFNSSNTNNINTKYNQTNRNNQNNNIEVNNKNNI